jgi:hypothetical protein
MTCTVIPDISINRIAGCTVTAGFLASHPDIENINLRTDILAVTSITFVGN